MKSIIDAYHRMIQPVEAKVELQETTVPEDLHHIPDRWDHHGLVDDDTMEKMRHALPHGNHDHFPLDTSASAADPDVVEHLNNHGYSIKDYRNGIATKKITVGNPNRGIPLRDKVVEEKIGSVLEKTNAADHVKHAFANDPSRQASKAGSDGLHVVIGTSPLAIAGMTTGTHWHNQSCMNMQGGAYAHKLEKDSEHGTHVAFLCSQDDHTAFAHGEPSKPIARIALKPFHGKTPEGELDTIFRPETKAYGNGSTHFASAVNKWATEKYPAIPGVKYEKNASVYDDSGNDTYHTLSEDDVKDHLDEGRHLVQNSGQMVDHHVIETAMNHLPKLDPFTQRQAIRSISMIGNLTTHHVAKLNKLVEPGSEHDSVDVRKILAHRQGDKFSTAAIEQHVKDVGVDSLGGKVLMSPKLPDHVLDTIDPRAYMYVRKSKLKDKHIDRAVDHAIQTNAESSVSELKSLLKPHHIKTLIADTRPAYRDSRIGRYADAPGFTKEVHDYALDLLSQSPKASDLGMSALVGNSKHASVDDLDKFHASHVKVDPNATPNNMFARLLRNDNIPDAEAKRVKDRYMSTVKPGQRYMLENIPYSGNSIPAHISKHMTDDDFKKLAEGPMRGSFEDVEHSNKFLDLQHKHVMKLDKALEDHQHEHEDSEDDDVIEHGEKLKNELHAGMQAYHQSLDNHVDWHVEDEDGLIKSDREFENIQNRIRKVRDWSRAYATPSNSNRYDDYEHYYDHFGELENRLDKIQEATEDHHGGW